MKPLTHYFHMKMKILAEFQICISVPLKKKILRANNAPYLTKKLKKVIMKRSQLEKSYWKTLTETFLKVYYVF